MKGMIGGSSLVTVSLYDRWFLDGSCQQKDAQCFFLSVVCSQNILDDQFKH